MITQDDAEDQKYFEALIEGMLDDAYEHRRDGSLAETAPIVMHLDGHVQDVNDVVRLIPFSPVGLHVDAAQNLAPVA
jgi:hypothetical protein